MKNIKQIEISDNLSSAFAELGDYLIHYNKKDVAKELDDLLLHFTTELHGPIEKRIERNGHIQIAISKNLHDELLDFVDVAGDLQGAKTSRELANLIKFHIVLEAN